MQLPPKLDDMPHCIVRKELGPGPNNREYRDFKVRRNVVHRLITTLKRTFPHNYGNVQINEENLGALPEDGNIFEQLPQVNESDVSQHVSQFSPSQTNELDTSKSEDTDEEDTNQQQNGPEQGGATGIHSEDTDETLLQSDYLPIPPQQHGRVEDEINQTLGTEANPLMWPNQTNRVSDFNTPYLQAKCFPYLFPYGHGDVTMKDRQRDVTLTDLNTSLTGTV